MKEKRVKEIDGCEFGNRRVFVCMFLVFCFVFKVVRDLRMLVKGKEEFSRGGNLEIFKR